MFERPKFKIIYSNEVIEFLNSLENKVKEKIMFNINKSKYVVDTELFKKLKGSNIWEFRTKYKWFYLQSFCLLGYRSRYIGYYNPWYHQKDAKDSGKRNSKGRVNKARIF